MKKYAWTSRLVFVLFLFALGTGFPCQSRTHGVEPTVQGGLKQLPDKDWSWANARHLLARAGFSGTSDQITELHQMGLEKAVDYMLNFNKSQGKEVLSDELLDLIDRDPTDRKKDKSGPQLDLLIRSPQWEKVYNETTIKPDKNHPVADFSKVHMVDLLTKGKDGKPSLEKKRLLERLKLFEFMRADWMEQLITSENPLEEKMVLFWHGHFTSDYATVEDSYMLYLQNYLFHKYSAGNYGELLHGIVHDPAMLRYLDNNTNVKGHPNENLARELMELFSMGEGNGYTEKDVKEGARALTGNKYDARNKGLFYFDEDNHDFGQKTIFGHTGNYNGDHFVDLILAQPETASFMAAKLFAFFAYEGPESEVVEPLARTFRENHFDVKPVLREMFLSEAFYSEKAIGTHIKSPIQLVVGTFRKLGLEQGDYSSIIKASNLMGQALFQPPDVKGWDGGRTWINATRLFARQNFSGYLVEGKETLFSNGRSIGKPRPGIRPGVDIVGLLDGNELTNSSEVVDHFMKNMFSISVQESKRQKLINVLDKGGALPPSSRWRSQRTRINEKLQLLLVLMISMPEYQLC
ncbi:MAG: DUF1800 domain-containing protein [Pirellulaceae bacterium]|nr:DUF1800 domain-containing protein [Pirellulaceae bacterium]